MSLKVVIVGGVAGGASTAARLRRINESAEIVLFEKGEYISFANCGLPYYIGDVITEKEKLLVQTPKGMGKRFHMDIRINSEVTKINIANKTVTVVEKETGKTYEESYDKLVLSPGADPIIPPIEGIDNPKIFTLRNIPDTYKIKDYINEHKPQTALIVGAGFIGLEMAENLQMLGIKTSVVELSDHVIGALDYEMAAIVHEHLKNQGISLYLNTAVTGFEDNYNGLSVKLSKGDNIKADMVIMGVGVKPETRLAAEAGLTIGKTRGIVTNAQMQTSNEDIYAVGDAVEVTDFVSGTEALIPLAGPANKQGRIAANNICGRADSFKGTQGTAIVKVFDLTVAVTGNTESSLKKKNIEFEKSYTHPASHANYYPGAIPMSIKLLFSKTDGKILGAQLIGYDGVDKRADVFSTAMRSGLSVYDLEELELCYAPPFSSAKDPVNLAGFTASNILKKDCEVFHWDEISAIDMQKSVLIDTRTKEEFALGTIENAINVPVDSLRDRLGEIPKDKDIYIFCQVGLRGYIAVRILLQSGFSSVKNLSGGYKTYCNGIIKNTGESIVRNEDLIQTKSDLSSIPTITVNACGLQCPGPILKVYDAIKDMKNGDVLEIQSTDPSFAEDIKVWCKTTGNELLDIKFEKKAFVSKIRKKDKLVEVGQCVNKNGKSLIVFSNDLDKAIATFIIANGAAAMGREVTLFFTFWGLNILRKPHGKPVKKDIISKMFGFMMPKGSKHLSLSKMNMMGMGGMMIRFLMKKKNISSLEELIDQAIKNGVKLVACTMSMDIMGIKREELIDEITIGGVASFLGSAEDSDMSLFI